jgi:AcrR family transcriptional regulator
MNQNAVYHGRAGDRSGVPYGGLRRALQRARPSMSEQLLKAADVHFRHYGYNKTTVGDLAKTIGLLTAYIYKYFESKQAIREAICTGVLGGIAAELRMIAKEQESAASRILAIYQTLARRGSELFSTLRLDARLFDPSGLCRPMTVVRDCAHSSQLLCVLRMVGATSLRCRPSPRFRLRSDQPVRRRGTRCFRFWRWRGACRNFLSVLNLTPLRSCDTPHPKLSNAARR